MSVEFHVFIEDVKVPTRDAWQAQVEQLGFDLVLYPTLDLRKDTGFSPTTYKGSATGFEIYLYPTEEILENNPEVAEKVGNRNQCATFRFGGDITEGKTAMLASAALAKLTDGIAYYEDDDILYTVDEVIEEARKFPDR